MSRVFRRRKRTGEEAGEAVEAEGVDLEEQGAEDGAVDEPAVPARPQGPWDVDDAPQDDVSRLDLGGMLVPVPADTEVRVEVNQQGEVVAATLVRAPSTMQVNVFAAPKRSGIWDEVRAEIAEALVGGGGRADEAEGPYGAELLGAVPVQSGGLAPARFVGVDGPRWFLRALLTGPAALDREVAAPFEEALRDVVVVRGSEAMAVRDPLPLRLPREAAEQAAQVAAAAEQEPTGPVDEHPQLQMPERGPEITELR